MNKMNQKILKLVYILGNRQNNEIKKHFTKKAGFDLKKIKSVRISDLAISSYCDTKKFLANYGFNPTKEIVGCALIHQKSYLSLLRNQKNEVALILEDDAIPFPNINVNFIYEIIERASQSTCAEIYLLFFDPKLKSPKKDHITSVKFAPSYAVAYVVNKKAAKILIAAQKPLQYVADWPNCSQQIKYSLVHGDFFAHGSENGTYESFLNHQKNKPNKYFKLEIYFYYWYFKNKKYFVTKKFYFNSMIKPRLEYHFLILKNKLRISK